MKTTLNYFGLACLVGVMTMSNGCKKEQSIPTLTTTTVSQITTSSVVAGGNVTYDGGAEIKARGICWSIVQNPTINDNKFAVAAGPGNFSFAITNLAPNTTYYVRAYATNSEGTGYGNEITFTTSLPGLPTVTTSAASSVTSTTAVLSGNIVDDGGGELTTRGICLSTVQNPTISDIKTALVPSKGVFASYITGLAQNTTYYVRAYATNSVGTNYGNEVTFTTSMILLATLESTGIENVTMTTAGSGNNIIDDGGGDITARGVCWSTVPLPTVEDTKTIDSIGAGGFISNLAGLTPGTTYYIRAYAVNFAGVSYGLQTIFTTMGGTQGGPIIFNPDLTYGAVTDIDGNTYKTIQIGNQIWMAENLKTIRFNNDEAIPLVTDYAEWGNLTTSGYSWYNNDASTFKDTYGALYNWYAATDSRNICPTGWHVPSSGEWYTLATYLGGEYFAGGKVKETGTTHWSSPNQGASNESGFTGLPAGMRSDDLELMFTNIGYSGFWWSTTSYLGADYFSAWESSGWGFSNEYQENKTVGMSVRCVKD